MLYGRTTGIRASEYLSDDELQVVVGKELSEENSLKCLFGRTGVSRVAILAESGLYKIILRSSRPEARAFQDWVTRVVLPAIRKDGMYIKGEEKVATGEMTGDELMASTAITRHP